MSAVRVVIADDDTLLRTGVARVLTEAGLTVVGEAADVAQLETLVDRATPDVAVVDIRMPPTHTTEGLEAAIRIRERHPSLGLLLLSQHVETQHAQELIQGTSGGVGYLLKQRVTDTTAFARSVEDVAAGGTAIDPEIVGVLLGRRRRIDPLEMLTDRERDVLALMAEGRSNTSIADELSVSPKTVESNITRLFLKLGLDGADDRHRRVSAVLAYLRAGSTTATSR